LTLAHPDQTIRLGMTGDASLLPGAPPDGAPKRAPTFTVPPTALFHEGNSPAVFVVGAGNSTLELRPVTVRNYSSHSSAITGGLRDGDTVVLAGVHTVYVGERVTVVRPLFDGEGDVAGPDNSGKSGAGHAGTEQ
jgi:membrane fusion protein, multidrug efflux system